MQIPPWEETWFAGDEQAIIRHKWGWCQDYLKDRLGWYPMLPLGPGKMLWRLYYENGLEEAIWLLIIRESFWWKLKK